MAPTALARRIIRMVGLSILASRRAHETYRRFLLQRVRHPFQLPKILPGDQERAGEIRVDRRLPLREAHPRHWHIRGRPYAVVDDRDLHRPQRRGAPRKQSCDIPFDGQIRLRSNNPRGAKFRDQCVEGRRGGVIVGGYFRALFCRTQMCLLFGLPDNGRLTEK